MWCFLLEMETLEMNVTALQNVFDKIFFLKQNVI